MTFAFEQVLVLGTPFYCFCIHFVNRTSAIGLCTCRIKIETLSRGAGDKSGFVIARYQIIKMVDVRPNSCDELRAGDRSVDRMGPPLARYCHPSANVCQYIDLGEKAVRGMRYFANLLKS